MAVPAFLERDGYAPVRLLRGVAVHWCSCACHDGGMCGFDSCHCGRPGMARVRYPDRPPPAASSPFRWYWNDTPKSERPSPADGP